MIDWATKQWQAAVLWKMVIIKVSLLSLVTLGAAWQTATAGMDFGMLPKWDRVNILVGIFVLWGNQMVAFLDKSAGQISSGKMPIGEPGNTEQIRKQEENG